MTTSQRMNGQDGAISHHNPSSNYTSDGHDGIMFTKTSLDNEFTLQYIGNFIIKNR